MLVLNVLDPFFAGAVADLQSKGGSIYRGPVSSLQFELKELVLAECFSLAPVTEKHPRLSEFTHIQSCTLSLME